MYTIPYNNSFYVLKEYLLLFCIDPTSVFSKDTDNLELYTQIYNTKNIQDLKSYLIWNKKGDSVDALIKWFKLFTPKEKDIKFTEDYGVISDTLKKYRKICNMFRSIPDLKTGESVDYSIYKNILQFKSLTEFYDVMSIFEKEQTKSEKLREIKEDVLVVYYADDLKILVPLTEEASKIYGKGTKWCTAADNNNMFIEYAEDGPLFIIIKNDEKYQFHFESNSYMNAQDKKIENYKELFASELNLIEEWQKNNLKIYFNIIEFSKFNIKITKDTYRYIKYLKYNKNNELEIRIFYLNQHIIDILDSLNCEITAHLEFENQYKELHNKRKYTIIYKDKFKYYFKDEFIYNINLLFEMYYKVDGTYKIIENKFYIDGDLKLNKRCTKMPPLIIEEVSGDFDCANNNLISLKHGPKHIGKSYWCSKNKLKTLKGCAKIIGNYLSCFNNKLKTLKYCPKFLYNLDCAQNQLKTLKGCPKKLNLFSCFENQLESLEYGPIHVDTDYWCSYNKLKTLKGCAEIINGNFWCYGNELESLEYGPKRVNKNYHCFRNKKILELPEKLILKGEFKNIYV